MILPDEVTAVLAGIRKRAEATERAGYRIGEDACLLLAVVDEVLKEHRKITLYEVAVPGYGEYTILCGHTEAEMENDRHEHDADGNGILCLDQPIADVCEACREDSGEQADWPCPTVQAISRALLGTEGE